jgi:hypothetical protein
VGVEVAGGQQVAHGGEPGGGALQHGDAGGPQKGGVGRVDGGGQAADHRDRLAGASQRLDGQAGVAGLGGGLGGEVQVDRQGGGVGVLQQRADAGGEDGVGVVAGAPGVQRVGGRQPWLQHGRQPPPGRLGDAGQPHLTLLGQVDQVGSLAAGVVDGGQPAGEGRAAGGEQLAGVGQLVEGVRPRHSVGVEQRLVGAVLAGDGAGVGCHHRPAGAAAADLQGDHLHAPVGRLGQGRPERGRLPDGLEEQRHHPGALQLQGVVEVGGGAGGQLHAARDDQVEAEPPLVVEQGREHRPGVADHRDRPARQVLQLGVAADPQALLEVEEAHAVAAADRHPGRLGDRPQPLGQPVGGAAGEDHRGRDGGAGGRLQLRLQRVVGDRQHRQVDRPRQLGEGGPAGEPEHLRVAGVDRVDRPLVAAPQQLGEELLAERPRPGAGADHRHRACLEHRGEGSAEPVHDLGGRRLVRLRSARIARTAWWPGMPQTPPPPWVAELAW